MSAADPFVETFVVAATISARLHDVIRLAEDISIAAMNAKTIAARAGDQARGFGPITDFIDDLARNATRLARRVSAESETLSRITAQRYRAYHADRRLAVVGAQAADLDNFISLAPAIERERAEVARLARAFADSQRELLSCLDEIDSIVRATHMIAITSRIEASNTAIHRDSLRAIAESVAASAEAIRAAVQDCRLRLAATD